jgi:hypothetical protein
MAQHVLDAGLEGRGRARAARARALHVQVDDAVLEAVEDDVAAILGDGGAHPRVEQLLDLGDDLVLGPVGRGLGGSGRIEKDGLARGEVLHDRAEDGRLEHLPIPPGLLGHGHEIAAEEDAGHALDLEQAFCKRGARGRLGAREVGGPGAHHLASRQEFERRGVRRRLGLDEHPRSLA